MIICSWNIWAQDNRLLSYIQSNSDIREGGSGLYEYRGNTYAISVAEVAVGNKKESDCKKIGATKAKREMISYINGSEITSYTELIISEDINESVSGKTVNASQHYKEVIREKAIGSINEIRNLGGWFSEDGTVYYFAIYKIIE